MVRSADIAYLSEASYSRDIASEVKHWGRNFFASSSVFGWISSSLPVSCADPPGSIPDVIVGKVLSARYFFALVWPARHVQLRAAAISLFLLRTRWPAPLFDFISTILFYTTAIFLLFSDRSVALDRQSVCMSRLASWLAECIICGDRIPSPYAFKLAFLVYV